MGTTVNSVTGDLIKTKVRDQKAYEAGWDAIFGKKEKANDNDVQSDSGRVEQDSSVAED